MVNKAVDRESLETLAKEIAKCATLADEHTIRAAFLVREARERVDAGEAGDIKWYEWAPKNIKLSISRLRELQSIADAKDSKAELERLRKLNGTRQARHREKKKTAPLRNGDVATEPGEMKKTAPLPGGGTATDPLDNKSAAPLRNGGTTSGVTAESRDDRKALIKWTQSAPLEQVTEVLTYIQRFDSAAAVSASNEVAERAAA